MVFGLTEESFSLASLEIECSLSNSKSAAPMIRMNFGSTWPSSILSDKEMGIKVFPNPTATNKIYFELLLDHKLVYSTQVIHHFFYF